MPYFLMIVNAFKLKKVEISSIEIETRKNLVSVKSSNIAEWHPVCLPQ